LVVEVRVRTDLKAMCLSSNRLQQGGTARSVAGQSCGTGENAIFTQEDLAHTTARQAVSSRRALVKSRCFVTRDQK
jgi:hypothetical protein